MKFIPPVTRVDRRNYHIYKDGDNNQIPGVTTILGDGLPKKALIEWAGNATAEAAINRWDELADLPPAQRYDTLRRARYDTTDKAKRRGTEVHTYAERLVQGERVEGIPDELRGHTEAYVRFIDKFELDPILVEVVIVHYDLGYAGTLDLVADLTTSTGKRERWLLDIKTNEKGIWPETALQLAAYRYAQFYVDNQSQEQSMIPVDACGAIHITSDDAQLIPTVSGADELKQFRIAAKVRDFTKNGDGLILPPMPPKDPTPSAARLIWEDQ